MKIERKDISQDILQELDNKGSYRTDTEIGIDRNMNRIETFSIYTKSKDINGEDIYEHSYCQYL